MKKFMSIMLAMLLLVATMSLPVMAASAGPDGNTGVVEGVETGIDGGESEDVPGDAEEGEVTDSDETEVSTLFPFQVVLRDADGNELTGTYKYEGSYTGTLQSGDTIYLADGEYIDVLELPEGTQYSVTELPTEGWSLVESQNTSGGIEYNKTTDAHFVNQQVVLRPEMPETGGHGVVGYAMSGMGLISFGIMLCGVFRVATLKTKRNVLK